MTRPLHVLIAEDSEDDAMLAVRALRGDGRAVRYERVETPSTFREALAREPWDVVLADAHMPQLGMREALDLVRGAGLDVPFIIVSGTISEQEAVEAMRAGASDYVMKTNLGRLAVAVDREVVEARHREAERRAVRERAESEDFLRAVMGGVPDAIVVCADDGRVVLANEAAERVFGFEARELVGLHVSAVLPGASAASGASGELVGVRKDGASLVVDVARSELAREGRTVTVLIARDVTRRKALDEQAQHAERMQSVVTLAGGLAHDLNNILTGILTFAELVKDASPPEVRPDVEEIERQGHRAAELVRKLLAVSRQQVLQPVRMPLNDVVRGMVSLVRKLLVEEIAIVVSADARPDLVLADAGQIERALMNLCLNAGDAMARGGVLEIGTTHRALDAAFCRANPWARPGDYVELVVRDTGTGMDPHTLRHAFEPFFTTKPVGRGTGLGLSVVHGIVEQHDGLLRVESAPGVGTTFRIYLRAAAADQAALDASVPAASPRAGATVLVADEERAICMLMARVLRDAGYTVVAAASAAEATRALEETPDVALAILDMRMAELGGLSIHETLRGRYPGLRVLFMSAYPTRARDYETLLRAGAQFLEKPFSVTDLEQRVRRVLTA